MIKTEQLISSLENVKATYYKAGDVVVITRRQFGDPYLSQLCTPVILFNDDTFCFSALSEGVSLYTHRVFTSSTEPYNDKRITNMRLATEAERQAYYQAVSDNTLPLLIDGYNSKYNK